MAVKDFRDLMRDLEEDLSPWVYVTIWSGEVYHSSPDCGALSISNPSQMRRIPLKLAKWLDYEKPCQLCG